MDKFTNDMRNLAVQHMAYNAARFEGEALRDWVAGRISDEEMTAISDRLVRVVDAAVSLGLSRRDLPA